MNESRPLWRRAALSLLLGTVLFAACDKQESAGTSPGRQESAGTSPGKQESAGTSTEIDEATWADDLARHRVEIDEDYKTSPKSPLAGAQYLKSEPADLRVYLNRKDRIFALANAESPAAALVTSQRNGVWYWETLNDDVVCEIEDEPVPTGAALDSPATFTIDDLILSFHPGEEQVTFIVFDHRRPEIQEFEHLLYYPAAIDFAVPARLVKLPEPEPLEMPTTRGLVKTFYRYAKVEFQIDGERQELTAFKYGLEGDAAKGLFIPFKDTTTGRETYGAGRYLQIDDPENDNLILDFNRAFNPLCNYSPAYNCTLPPRENHLKVAIRAGEKTYPEQDGTH